MAAQVWITHKPVRVNAVLRSVASRSAGGTVVFVGTVRDRSEGRRVTGIEVESDEALAKKDLLRISELATRKFGAKKIAIEHRMGRLRVGDVIIAIAVSAAHRREAFAACGFIIDELKKTTPIWKKELGPGLKRWVGEERN